MAAELGKNGIRVNTVNPDAVIKGSNIWNNGWAEGLKPMGSQWMNYPRITPGVTSSTLYWKEQTSLKPF